MESNRSAPSPSPGDRKEGFVKTLDSVQLIAIRGGSDGIVRAKVRVKDGAFAGREFVTAQPKTEEAYSESEFSKDEIAAMKEQDERRDHSISPLASVVAEVEGGRVHPMDPSPLLEPEPYNRFKPFLRKKH